MKNKKSKKHRPSLNRSPRFSIILLAFVVLGLCAIGYYLLSVGAETGYNSTSGRPFASTSPFNDKVPTSPQIDSNSTAVAGAIISHNKGGSNENGYVHLVEFAHPVYFVTGSEPKYNIVCTMNWGTCPFAGMQVPIPAGATPGANSDAPLNIVDLSKGIAYEFWQAASGPSGSNWTVSWGATSNLNGDSSNTTGSSTGANISRLAGIVRPSEISAGYIPHALTMSTDASCGPNNSTNFRYPARKTDGGSSLSNCIIEGGRVYLQMTQAELDAIPGLNKAEKTFAKALAEYGVYNIDNGGTNNGSGTGINLGIEKDLSHPNLSSGNPFYDAGMTWDYYPVFSKLFKYLADNGKSNRLIYLAPQWNKDGTKAYNWGGTTPPAKQGDLNSDSKVDIFDLSILLSNYNKTGTNTADINGDNIVNITDLSILLSKWGT